VVSKLLSFTVGSLNMTTTPHEDEGDQGKGPLMADG